MIWKVLADVACVGRTPPCQLPHLECLGVGKQSGEAEGLFSMPAYMKKNREAHRGASASSNRIHINPPLHLVLKDVNTTGKSSQHSRFSSVAKLQNCEVEFVWETSSWPSSTDERRAQDILWLLQVIFLEHFQFHQEQKSVNRNLLIGQCGFANA